MPLLRRSIASPSGTFGGAIFVVLLIEASRCIAAQGSSRSACERITRTLNVDSRCPATRRPWKDGTRSDSLLTSHGWHETNPKVRNPVNLFCIDPNPNAPKLSRVSGCDLSNATRFAEECKLRLPFPRMRTMFDPKCEFGCRIPRTKRPIVPFKSCAVVSSSGSLLHSGCGPSIDQHELVIRTNVPVVRGFTADVGERTTHVLVNTVVAQAMVGRNRTVGKPPRPIHMGGGAVVVAASNPAFAKLLLAKFAENTHSLWHRYQTSSLWMPHHELWYLRYVIAWWCALHDSSLKLEFSTSNPSKGIEAIAFAASMCKQVILYGYEGNSKGQPYRYWERSAYNLKPGLDHNTRLERILINRLSKPSKRNGEKFFCSNSGWQPDKAAKPLNDTLPLRAR